MDSSTATTLTVINLHRDGHQRRHRYGEGGKQRHLQQEDDHHDADQLHGPLLRVLTTYDVREAITVPVAPGARRGRGDDCPLLRPTYHHGQAGDRGFPNQDTEQGEKLR